MFKNLKIHAFTQPSFIDEEPEVAAQGLERAIIMNFDGKSELVQPYQNLEMYYIGTFNDETGVFTSLEEPVLLFSPRELIVQLAAERVEKSKKVTKRKEVGV